jgi:hypothetical protein
MLTYLKATVQDKRPWGHRRDKDAIRHLRSYFSGRELTGLTAADVRGYVEHRRVALVGNATINRELCVLSAASTMLGASGSGRFQIPFQGASSKSRKAVCGG